MSRRYKSKSNPRIAVHELNSPSPDVELDDEEEAPRHNSEGFDDNKVL